MTNNASLSSPATTGISVFNGLSPLVLIVFFGFLAIGLPLAALSLHVHGELGFSSVVVGWVIGGQSIVTVLTRHRAGTLCDHRGAKASVLSGLPLAAGAGVLYWVSALLHDATLSLVVLLIGRVLLGLGESLFITGTMSWGIGRLGPARTGKVMSWQGIAMYAALGLGAPLGLAIQEAAGFAGVAIASVVVPLTAMAIALFLPGTPALGRSGRVPFHRVIGLIWHPGLVLALATVPFAAMAAFLALDYAGKGWDGAGLALTGFGAGFVAMRLAFAHLPDKLGGAKVAFWSIAIEAVGQAVLWAAPTASVALAGATLTGIGFSLVFPAMGVEATRRVAPEQRGRAVGNFMAFFDIAIGLTGPAIGLVIGGFGYASAFVIGGLCALGAVVMLWQAARAA